MVVKRARAAVELALAKRKAMDAPIYFYDSKRQGIIRQDSDGTEVIVAKGLKKGHYSEWAKGGEKNSSSSI